MAVELTCKSYWKKRLLGSTPCSKTQSSIQACSSGSKWKALDEAS